MAKERASREQAEYQLLVGAAKGVSVLKRRMLKNVLTVNLYTTLAVTFVAEFMLKPQSHSMEVDRSLEKSLTRSFHAGKSVQVANQFY